jgi:hypothetical protein
LPNNPTVVGYRDRIFVNVCLVNYRHDRGCSFVSNDSDGVIRTRSAIVEWDPEQAVATHEWEPEIQLSSNWDAMPSARGLGDQRWVVHGGRVWFTSTTCHAPGAAGDQRVVLGRMSEDLRGISNLLPLVYAGGRSSERDWIPWSIGDDLHLICAFDPFVVLRVNTDSGKCTEVMRWIPPWSAARWHGGAPPVPRPEFSDRWVGLVHETVSLDGGNVYLHRWVELGAQVIAERQAGKFRVVRFSPPFSFERHGVERACGLLDRGDGTVLVTYGSDEREAHWALFEWDEIEQMLAKGPASP